MKSAQSKDPGREPVRDEAVPSPERRAHERVRDDQQTGQGSASAWSKLKMMERKRASLAPRPEAD